MAKLIVVSILLLFFTESSKSLTKSAIRELTGLHSLAHQYQLPSSGNVSNGTVYPGVSKACETALVELLNSSRAFATYSDASGRPGSGFLSGNLVWLGSYSQCQNTPGAKYCLAPNVLIEITGQPKPIPLEWGVCVPEACSAQDVAFGFKGIVEGLRLVTEILDYENYSMPIHFPKPGETFTVGCAHSTKWTTGSIVTLVVCIVIICLCLAGTVADLCVVQGSWKFWLLPDMPSGIASSLSHEREETAPLLQGNGYLTSSDSPSQIQFKQHSVGERGFLLRFLICFSITRNTSKIMDCTVPPGAITSVNGVRVLSMWWVILGHTYLWLLLYRVVNDVVIGLNITHRFSFEAVNSAFFSVDSFFFLSGLLVGYIGFRRMEMNSGKLPLFQFYFHRFWRLTPSYMFTILFFTNMVAFLGDGPLWYGSQMLLGAGTKNPCVDKWWTNLLYINNLYPNSLIKECLGWSWYLANDMQFYVISPLLLFLVFRFRWKGVLVGVGGLLLISLAVTAIIIGVYNPDVLEAEGLELGFKEDPNRGSYSDLVYIKPYCRISPYLVGLALGYLIHIEKTAPSQSPLNKLRKQAVAVIGWCLASILGLTVVYGIYGATKQGGKPFNKVENILYGTFSRLTWGLALAWVIYACNRGYGSLVNKFLSASYWIPLSRLTYSAYLMHPIVLIVYFGSTHNTTEYSDMLFAFYFVSVVVMSYAAAFVLAVCVEFPMMQLESVLFFKKK
ncbi:nose resistant to fluoxetine protein 6-like [Acropora millepora]|uniref:nose resistant to fluoxetine protein 6-like n=1 Tax=Acropora millepora TaxID=45264 RepID=UPI001CF3553B|nr:nose resistant to fluoxetine protein 6-like [Acropora millepora]